MYPTKIEANGHIYNINTDYRIALACLKAINDDEISDFQRYIAIETLLLGTDIIDSDREVLKQKIEIYLRCGESENTPDTEIDFDYFQDDRYIKTSIRQCYHGLNLNNIQYMHWWEYNDLISGLAPDSVLNRIRELRQYNENDIKDPNEREKIKKAKQHVALKRKKKKVELTEEEMRNVEQFYKKMQQERGDTL